MHPIRATSRPPSRDGPGPLSGTDGPRPGWINARSPAPGQAGRMLRPRRDGRGGRHRCQRPCQQRRLSAMGPGGGHGALVRGRRPAAGVERVVGRRPARDRLQEAGPARRRADRAHLGRRDVRRDQRALLRRVPPVGRAGAGEGPHDLVHLRPGHWPTGRGSRSRRGPISPAARAGPRPAREAGQDRPGPDPAAPAVEASGQ